MGTDNDGSGGSDSDEDHISSTEMCFDESGIPWGRASVVTPERRSAAEKEGAASASGELSNGTGQLRASAPKAHGLLAASEVAGAKIDSGPELSQDTSSPGIVNGEPDDGSCLRRFEDAADQPRNCGKRVQIFLGPIELFGTSGDIFIVWNRDTGSTVTFSDLASARACALYDFSHYIDNSNRRCFE